MAQAEDTELRDLVLETLEKNGSLAKVRALLRANIFLAFEDESQKSKQNVNLDNILNIPEGLLALSIIHEFLEFCNLKNTLFVYMSESRQGKDYRYEGHKLLANKLNLSRDLKEPLLLSLLKNLKGKYYEQGNAGNSKQDEENCTYIVHEDSSCTTTSQSQSDNSSDEKNKLHLRLNLDNSDTDTSSDSARDKSCSEYIPNEHTIKSPNKCDKPNFDKCDDNYDKNTQKNRELNQAHSIHANNNSTSESTSYLELKPLNALDHKMHNTPGVPYQRVNDPNIIKQNENLESMPVETQQSTSKSDPISPASLSNVSSLSFKMDTNKITIRNPDSSTTDKVDYSYDFSSSLTKNASDATNFLQKPDEDMNDSNKNTALDSPHQNSQSSQSSISISDVADLISEKSTSYNQLSAANVKSPSHHSKQISNDDKENYDSGEFSDSPIPSLSNLSLDIHSD